jgi:hypothetical protein
MKNKSRKPERIAGPLRLNEDVPEEYREIPDHQWEQQQPDTSQNLSQPEDRGEDLVNQTDPFVQQPERDTQLPPELIQQRAYQLYEQRRDRPGDDLADWFEAERLSSGS